MTPNNSTFLRSLIRPSPNINYDFISLAYGCASILAVFLYLIERFSLSPHLHEDSNQHETLHELAESTQGLYLIFVPFIPCVFWSLIVRQQWKNLDPVVVVADEKKSV